MKTSNTKVFFRYEKEEAKDENGQQIMKNGKPIMKNKVNGKIEVVAINVEDSKEIARREVKLRHGDNPDKVVGRTYAFRKLAKYILENKLLPGKEVEILYREFGKTCRQPEIKLAY
jgi:hypothetical protein